eukprot:80066_1
MADVIRKYMLEFDRSVRLWPWYTNSKYCNNPKGKELYNKLMGKFNLVYAFDDVLTRYRKDQAARLEQSKEDERDKQEVDEKDKPSQSIRHKRKFAAIQLLRTNSERNLNYLRPYLNALKLEKKEEEEQG